MAIMLLPPCSGLPFLPHILRWPSAAQGSLIQASDTEAEISGRQGWDCNLISSPVLPKGVCQATWGMDRAAGQPWYPYRTGSRVLSIG